MNIEARAKLGELQAGGVLPAYHQDIRTFNRWSNGRPITAETVAEYFDHLRKLGRKAATIERHKAAIKAALKSSAQGLTYAAAAQLDAFFKTIKGGRRAEAITVDAILSRTELQALIKAAGPKTGLVIRALFETAARVSELVNIRLADCTRKAAGVEIRITGKGRKEGVLFMSCELFDAIQDTFKGRQFLFENSTTGRPITRQNVHILIKRASWSIDRPDIHAHTLRHTWASMAIHTLGLAKVSKQLRHSSPDITARYYLHGQASIAEVMQTNNQILGAE